MLVLAFTTLHFVFYFVNFFSVSCFINFNSLSHIVNFTVSRILLVFPVLLFIFPVLLIFIVNFYSLSIIASPPPSLTPQTGLGFVCFVDPGVLSANRVDLGFFVS